MRGIIAVALACLLSCTAPVFAADLEVPPLVTKEAPIAPIAPVADFDYVPLVVGGIIAAGVIVCILECAGHHNAAPIPVSPGAS
jgi:xanthine/uracil permease